MKIAMLNVSGRLSSEGSRLISSLLKKDGHSITNIFLARGFPIQYEREELEQLHEILKNVDLAMVAVYSQFSYRAVQVTEFIHKHYPGMKVIWGGPHCVASPELSLDIADGVCFSEGDICVPEFVKKLEANDESYLETPNMAFRVNGSNIVNEILPPFKDLNSLPFCDFTLDGNFILDKTLKPLSKELMQTYLSTFPYGGPTFHTVTSRGCPHRCSYCNNCRYIAMFGRNAIRKQSVDRFMDELEHHLGIVESVKGICLSDDDFLIRPVRELEQFAERYKKNIEFPFLVCMSAKTYRKEKIDVLLDAGIKFVVIGVQSGSDRTLEEVFDRPIPLTKIKEIVRELEPYYKKHDLRMSLDFITDVPYETREDLADTYKYILDLPRHSRIQFYTLYFSPGTPIYDRALKDGIIEPFSDKTFRSLDDKITYQKNYETFLIFFFIFLHRRRLRRFIPTFLLRLMAARPLRAAVNLLPWKAIQAPLIVVRKLTPDTSVT